MMSDKTAADAQAARVAASASTSPAAAASAPGIAEAGIADGALVSSEIVAPGAATPGAAVIGIPAAPIAEALEPNRITSPPKEGAAHPASVSLWRSIAIFFRTVGGFFVGKSALRAWLLAAIVVGSQLLNVYMQVALTNWNRDFFDALDRKTMPALMQAVSWLPLLLFGVAASVSVLVVSKMLFQLRWRQWATDRLVGWWIADQRYYRLSLTAPELTVPEFRIASDLDLAISPLVEFALGLFSAIVTAAAFAAILWYVAGSIDVTLGGKTYQIPGYMALAAVAFALAASAAAYYTGRPLVQQVSDKNDAEADFRAETTRLRENAESIAQSKGDAQELSTVRGLFDRIVKTSLAVVKQNGIIALVLNTNGAVAPILPLLLATPKYMKGEISLGAVMQLVAAFGAVQGALMWFVNNFVGLATWYASVTRVNDLTVALRDLDVGRMRTGDSLIQTVASPDDTLGIHNLVIAMRSGQSVIKESSLIIAPAEKILVKGVSGSGKSILIRAIAGLWPWGSGTIAMPSGKRLAFVPQSPYLPAGNLRAVICYSTGNEDYPTQRIEAAMQRCGLGYLVPRLEEEARWDQTLSSGERQRLAFVRLLLQDPDIIIMDNAASALAEPAELSLLQILREDLSRSMVIGVGHSPAAEEFYDRAVELERQGSTSTIRTRSLAPSRWRKASADRARAGASKARSLATRIARNIPGVGRNGKPRDPA